MLSYHFKKFDIEIKDILMRYNQKKIILQTNHKEKIRIGYVLKSADVETLFSSRYSENSSLAHTRRHPHTFTPVHTCAHLCTPTHTAHTSAHLCTPMHTHPHSAPLCIPAHNLAYPRTPTHTHAHPRAHPRTPAPGYD